METIARVISPLAGMFLLSSCEGAHLPVGFLWEFNEASCFPGMIMYSVTLDLPVMPFLCDWLQLDLRVFIHSAQNSGFMSFRSPTSAGGF